MFRLSDSPVGKESACNVADLGVIPGLGRSPGEGKDYPCQYSGLENSKDCIGHGVAKSPTPLNHFHFHVLIWVSLVAQQLKNPPANAAATGSVPVLGRSPGEGNATYSCILAWEITWTEGPGKLQFMGLHRVKYDLVTKQQQHVLIYIILIIFVVPLCFFHLFLTFLVLWWFSLVLCLDFFLIFSCIFTINLLFLVTVKFTYAILCK